MPEDTTPTALERWDDLIETQRMNRIWRSYVRLVVEEVEPDRWSIGPYIEATMHYHRCPEHFAPESIEKVKAYIRANHPQSWAQYEALIPPGYRIQFVAE